MLNLPVHRLSNDEKTSFQFFLKTMSRIKSYYIVDHNNTKCIFLYESKAKEYATHHNIDKTVDTVSMLSEGITYQVSPCIYCKMKPIESISIKEVIMRLCEQLFIEKIYEDTAKRYFESKRVNRLIALSKDILEHYNPENPYAHFYLGFSFYVLGDIQNFDQAKKNLKEIDKQLYSKLCEISNV